MERLMSIFWGRPRSACVFLAVIACCGIAGIMSMPISDYPETVPTMVSVSTSYSGASPKVVADTVATPIENEINSVDNVEHFESTCSDSGSYSLSVTFKPGTDPDINLVNVQNAVKRAEPKLPGEVVQLGITVGKAQSDSMLRLAFTTKDKDDDLYLLGNFACTEIREALRRVEGVSQVSTSSSGDYAMRIWLDSVKMDALGVSVFDIRSAISQQNIQPAAGNVGSSFASSCLAYKINVAGRLAKPEEFAAIVIRSDPKTGARVLLGDIARCELGVKSYESEPRVDGKPGFVMSVYRDPSANMADTLRRCKETLAEWMQRLPQGGTCKILWDASAFTKEFSGGLLRGFLAAAVVVALCLCVLGGGAMTFHAVSLLLFALLGTAAVMRSVNLAVNAFTLLGLTFALAHMGSNAAYLSDTLRDERTSNLSGFRDVVRNRIGRIVRPIMLSTAVTLVAYAPIFFSTDMVGRMYRCFAEALCTAVVLSAVLSIFVFPSLWDLLSRASHAGTGFFSRLRERVGRYAMDKYGMCLRVLLRHPIVTLFLACLTLACCILPVGQVEKEFVPKEERDTIKIECELSEGSSMARTKETVERVYERLHDMPGVMEFFTAAASSFLGRPGENRAEITLRLSPWSERLPRGLTLAKIAAEVERRLSDVYNARFTLLFPADLNGLGVYGGVTVYLCALTDDGPTVHAADAEAYASWLRSLPQVKGAATLFSADTPQLNLSVDRDKAQALGVTVNSIFATLQSKLASFYVNDFNLRGGAYQVVVQNALDGRRDLSDAYDIWLPGTSGAMVPLSSIGKFEYVLGPRVISRFNKFQSAGIVVTPAEGVSSLEIIDLIERHPPDPTRYVLNWSTVTLQEKSNRGRTEIMVLASLVGICIVLLVAYENWRLALLSLLVSVLAVAAGYVGTGLSGGRISIYSTLAIMFIIEYQICNMVAAFSFARKARREGMQQEEAAELGGRRAFQVNAPVAIAYMLGLVVFMAIDPGRVGAATRYGMALMVLFGVAAMLVVGLQLGPVVYLLSCGSDFRNPQKKFPLVSKVGI